MASGKKGGEGPITIKKYANRRLYNTGTSSYVTLEDLAEMVKNEELFVVYDAKSGDDITRDTVETATPARSATSRMVTLRSFIVLTFPLATPLPELPFWHAGRPP